MSRHILAFPLIVFAACGPGNIVRSDGAADTNADVSAHDAHDTPIATTDGEPR